ncbi:MAG: hypothetical protein AB9844_06230 [Clostridiaceae bacterium]
MNNNRASIIARGGLLVALGVLCVYLSSYLPTNKIFLQAIATCLIIVGIMITGVKNSIAIYSATALLSLLLCGVRLTTISYIIFFGLYGFVKHYIEGLNKIVVEYALKLLYCNFCIILLFIISRLFLPALFEFKISLYILVLAAQFIFLVYDYALSAFITYFRRRFPKLKI